MESRTVLLIAAAIWLLISHGPDLWNLLKSILSGAKGLIRLPKFSPKERLNPVIPQGDYLGRPSVDDRVKAFITLKPFLSPNEASSAWKRLEPEGPTVEEEGTAQW